MSTIQSERGCQDENEPQACRRGGHSYRQPTNEVPAGRGGLTESSELTGPSRPSLAQRSEAARGVQRRLPPCEAGAGIARADDRGGQHCAPEPAPGDGGGPCKHFFTLVILSRSEFTELEIQGIMARTPIP